MVQSTRGQWKPNTEFVTLPSGNSPRIRKLDVVSMIMDDGNVPDTLLALISQGGDMTQLSGNDMMALVKILNQMCRAVFVEPAIVDAPDYDANQISIYDVEFADKMSLFQYLVSGESVQAANFRQEQGADGDAAPSGEVIREAAE